MCDKAFNKCFIVFNDILDQYKTQKMCHSFISEDPFAINSTNKTQQMCHKAVDDCLVALKFVPDWFVTSKMIKTLLTALSTDDYILYFNEYSGNATFCCNEMGILDKDFNNINLDNTNYDEDDPETIIHIKLLAWHIKFQKRRALKKRVK